ncbi:hypothetical protein MKK58_04560 [Methylobacterium sp. J-078]|uniref:hypothetical protein n=1 Tax=Methylobacterium sp. J-078 TaxID=2836657 RepID=UPI001FBB37BA|nr:hypothetical protein [Methylobacterium sp. J-078]MCJ2043809.1 hypothetical protein [Methylobacterium sp. J-078]
MTDQLIPSRIITVRSINNRLTDGEEMASTQTIPSAWRDGDCVTVIFPNDERLHLFCDCDDHGPNAFWYQRNASQHWTIVIETVPATAGNYGALKAKFSSDHLDVQKRDDEEGR